jgi:hypothetical protein
VPWVGEIDEGKKEEIEGGLKEGSEFALMMKKILLSLM